MFGSPERIIAASQGDGSPGIIWVAINYRLGAFGWLGGPTLQTDGTANAGFYDQRLAIAWVRDHIAKFGGDGQSITIMGESAGGASVMHQICAFGGEKGVAFQRAIAQSPGFRPIVDKQTQEARLRDFLALLSVESLEEARLLPSARLIEANSQMIKRAEYGSYGFGPVIGDGFVPADPCLLFLQDRYAINVTVMSSFTSDEGAMFNDPSVTTETKFRARVHHYYSELSMEELDAMILSLYPPVYDGSRGYTSLSQRYKLVLSELLFTSNHNAMLQAAMRNGRDAFGYCFSIPPAIHGSDLSYTFHPSMGEVLSRHTAELIQAAIASFTKTGNPNATGTDTTFPVYDSRALMLDLNLATSVIKDPSDNDRCAFQQTAFTRRND
jgi:carboxylesterase type B